MTFKMALLISIDTISTLYSLTLIVLPIHHLKQVIEGKFVRLFNLLSFIILSLTINPLFQS